jgi:hypothetical protein
MITCTAEKTLTTQALTKGWADRFAQLGDAQPRSFGAAFHRTDAAPGPCPITAVGSPQRARKGVANHGD